MLYDTFNYYIDLTRVKLNLEVQPMELIILLLVIILILLICKVIKRLDSLLYGNAAKVTQNAVEAFSFEY